MTDLYSIDEYIRRNLLPGQGDAQWKTSRLIPLIDTYVRIKGKDRINLLDVGGGAGFILSQTSAYLEQKYGVSVRKIALDLSPGALDMQRNTNPDLKKVLNEDIRNTSLSEKEIDLALVIDVLEHVPEPQKALDELRRISSFVILKVPLEDNLYCNLANIISKGKLRIEHRDRGHINAYRWRTLKHQVEEHCGEIVMHDFADVSAYILPTIENRSPESQGRFNFLRRLLYLSASSLHKVSPRVSSWLFLDHALLLVQCR
jgi:SAM-dependent methyltransferase